MTPNASLRRFVRTFGAARDGNITIMFGFTFLFLTVIAGGTIDYVRWLDAKAKAENALDSAVLAGGRAMQVTGNMTEALAAAQLYYDRMGPKNTEGSSATFEIIEDNTVLRGKVDTTIRNLFLPVLGTAHQTIKIAAEAVIGAGGNSQTNVEVSMMLDVTGSMGGQKIVDMQAAAKDLIDIVVWNDQSQYTSKVAIAPFSPRVNTGQYTSAATGMPSSAVISGYTKYIKPCVTEREGAQAFTDAAPGANAYSRAYMANNTINTQNYTNAGTCNDPTADEQIVPLTNDKDVLKTRVDKLTANGSTAGQLGIAWAWYLISPNWANVWPSGSKPSSYSDLTTTGPGGKPKLQKIAVLMTDGVFNTYGATNFGDTSSEAVTISNNAVLLCNNMKAAGIKVYTVGFDFDGISNSTARQRAIDTMKACASRDPNDPPDNPSYFYNTTTGDDLKQAFRDIALKIATLRLRS
jgi:Flp pilus assembly protein TadG